MAKALFGGLVSELRGSIGNTTYSRTRGGNVVRQKTTNPFTHTFLRDLAWGRLLFVRDYWHSGISDTNRRNWIQFAAEQTRTHTSLWKNALTGQQWFIKLNIPHYGFTGAILTDPPASNYVAQLTRFEILSIKVSTSEFIIAWDPPLDADHTLRAACTKNMSPGRYSWMENCGFGGAAAPLATSPQNIWGQYTFFQAVPVAGKRIGARATILNTSNGYICRPLRSDFIVVA